MDNTMIVEAVATVLDGVSATAKGETDQPVTAIAEVEDLIVTAEATVEDLIMTAEASVEEMAVEAEADVVTRIVGGGAPEYRDTYVVTPTEETQVLKTKARTMRDDVIIRPIPSNYGRITWDGKTLTVS